MPNVNRLNGFRPVRYLNGAPYNGAATRYTVASDDTTALFIGDMVRLGTSTLLDPEGFRSVTRAVAGAAILGPVVGFEVDVQRLDTPQFRAASTKRYVLVADDPNLLHEAQEDGVGSPLTIHSGGLNVDLAIAAGNTVTGTSGMQIASNSVSTTNTLPLKLIEPVQRPDNEIVSAGQSFTRWVVKINNHQLGSGTGTTGV